jgi:hypothetical protein
VRWCGEVWCERNARGGWRGEPHGVGVGVGVMWCGRYCGGGMCGGGMCGEVCGGVGRRGVLCGVRWV